MKDKFIQSLDDKNQYMDLVNSGLICYKCGNAVEASAIGKSRIVKPNKRVCLCDSCKTVKVMETEYNSNLNIEGDR
ncbi:hypothetical protein [Clostridium butyricum]